MRAADEQIQLAAAASSRTQSAPRHFASINTLDGKTYEGVTVQKIQPDGLLVEFNTPGGGFGTAKIKFRNLPPSVRDQYGFDAHQAEAFEKSQAEGERVWYARNEAWAERNQAAAAAQRAREERLTDQARAEQAARQAADQARAEQQAETTQAYPYGVGWWSGGWYPQHRHIPHSVIQQTPPQPISPFIGPMRPLGK
jgi:hypothetical protein